MLALLNLNALLRRMEAAAGIGEEAAAAELRRIERELAAEPAAAAECAPT